MTDSVDDFFSELYTVTVLTEAAMMGTDIDGDVLVYLDMAQVMCPVNHHLTGTALEVLVYTYSLTHLLGGTGVKLTLIVVVSGAEPCPLVPSITGGPVPALLRTPG